MKKVAQTFDTLGNKYGKKDIERIGLFSEMPYMIGKGYISRVSRSPRAKGKNILAGGPKTKTGSQDCYFDKEFKRLFVGEALKGRGRKRKTTLAKYVSQKPFVPPGVPKRHACPGDWFGTFGGKVEAFGVGRKKKPPHKSQLTNLLTSPGKKGGYGYVDICFSPYPAHSIDRYGTKPKFKSYGKISHGPLVIGMHPKEYFEENPFKNPESIKPGPTYVPPKEKEKPFLPPGKIIPTGPSKLPGGCFSKFPEYKTSKYGGRLEVSKPSKAKGVFYPQRTAETSYYTCSIVNENIRFRLNIKNHDMYESSYVKHLVRD
ncbi:cilia-and flagella-associated protein 96-like [Cylas formicarius]|uniref:cilia-and flagella-associated protein 96-like n=1 Tax=Cylas formicarius TaxID=197179 RepID=UPI00295896B7|nr:cilia-and flagella-associated protein 96-like [Cylas formicarius]